MRVAMCPKCGHRMEKTDVDGTFTVYKCPFCGAGLIKSSKGADKTKRSALMKELGIESYREVEGGDLTEDDEDDGG